MICESLMEFYKMQMDLVSDQYLHFKKNYCCSVIVIPPFPPLLTPTPTIVSPLPSSVPVSPVFMFLCLPCYPLPPPSGHCQSVLFQVSGFDIIKYLFNHLIIFKIIFLFKYSTVIYFEVRI